MHLNSGEFSYVSSLTLARAKNRFRLCSTVRDVVVFSERLVAMRSVIFKGRKFATSMFSAVILLLPTCANSRGEGADSAAKPNVVFIVTDDQAESAALGTPKRLTPSMRSSPMRFISVGYVEKTIRRSSFALSLVMSTDDVLGSHLVKLRWACSEVRSCRLDFQSDPAPPASSVAGSTSHRTARWSPPCGNRCERPNPAARATSERHAERRSS